MNEQAERFEDKVTTVEIGPTVVEPSVHTPEKVRVEEFQVDTDALIAKIKDLIRQGNIRSIVIKNSLGRVLIEIPLTAGIVGGIVGTIIFPVAAVLAVVGVVAARLTIVITRKE
jgi:hypothetical protein